MTGVENLFVYWPGSRNLGPGRQSPQILLTGDATGTLGQLVKVNIFPLDTYQLYYLSSQLIKICCNQLVKRYALFIKLMETILQASKHLFTPIFFPLNRLIHIY